MTPYTSNSRIDYATSRLIELIQEQNLNTGDRLPNEQTLAELLGVGRGTIREAVRRLVTRNILITKQGSGTYVSSQLGVPEDPLGLTFVESGPKLILDLFDLRLMIEPEAAAMAALRITHDEKEELTQRCIILEKKILAMENYVTDETRFHSYISECSGNSVIPNLMPAITNAVTAAFLESKDCLRTYSVQQHRMILDAICSGDHVRARLAMIVHLNETREFFSKMLTDQQNGCSENP